MSLAIFKKFFYLCGKLLNRVLTIFDCVVHYPPVATILIEEYHVKKSIKFTNSLNGYFTHDE